MSYRFNRKTSQAKVDISSNVHFPTLSTENLVKVAAEWNIESTRKLSENAKIYSNGDTFEGEFDTDGSPLYGRLNYANGDVYIGILLSKWTRQTYIPDDISETSYSFCYNEEEEADDFDNYGQMTLANGKTFYGVFCFPDKNKWK
jgi:hypothetical protein